jgi:hypothetical protein
MLSSSIADGSRLKNCFPLLLCSPAGALVIKQRFLALEKNGKKKYYFFFIEQIVIVVILELFWSNISKKLLSLSLFLFSPSFSFSLSLSLSFSLSRNMEATLAPL